MSCISYLAEEGQVICCHSRLPTFFHCPYHAPAYLWLSRMEELVERTCMCFRRTGQGKNKACCKEKVPMKSLLRSACPGTSGGRRPREVRVKPAVSRDGLDPGIAEQTPSPPPLSNELLLQPLTLCFGGVRCPRVVAPREPSGSLLQTIKDTCLCHEDKNSQSATLGEDHMGEEGGGSHGDM